VAQAQTSKAMLIWGWILTILGGLATAMYGWMFVRALMDGLDIRTRFVVQIVIVVAMLVTGVVLLVRSRRR